jgi:hypothetical protein
MDKAILSGFFFLAITLSGRAQIQPSNIYLFDMKQVSDTSIEFSNPRWATFFNRNGYNNPSFVEDDILYISAQLPYQAQPDIIALRLRDTARMKVTATNAGEYSPTRMPDFYNFSAVRMEFSQGDTLLRLWQFPIQRRSPADNGKPVFKYINNIGYYHWLNTEQVVVFLVQEEPVLGIANTRTDDVQPLATNVGRTFRTLPSGKLVFVQKNNFGPWELMEMDPRPGSKPQKIINTLTGSEDFAILNDGTFLMGNGSKLYKYRRPFDEGWVEVGDFSYYDIRNITRLAVSRNGTLALVAQ